MRRFAPLPDSHPLVGDPTKTCPGCDEQFAPGDVTTLVSIGPGDDPEQRERARQGRPYNAIALPAHWACVTGEED